jgi:hypothetical protein
MRDLYVAWGIAAIAVLLICLGVIVVAFLDGEDRS